MSTVQANIIRLR